LKPYQKLKRYWDDTGAGIDTIELAAEQVEGLEQRYGIRLPSDFREYLLCSCPDGEVYEEDLTSWWSLDRIRNIPEEYNHEIVDNAIARDAAKYLFFADYSLWCFAWAIACGEDENRGKILIVSGRDRFVADSFSQFVDRYVADKKQVF